MHLYNRSYHNLNFIKIWPEKPLFFEGWSWFKFNNLGVALGTSLKFYKSLSKGLKLQVRKFRGLTPTFIEVTGEKLVGGPFCPPPILNMIKNHPFFFAKTLSNLPTVQVPLFWQPPVPSPVCWFFVSLTH